ncbi:MAG: phosphoglycerate dehydrogenase [Desulfovibrionaceae bacterium]|nr:phosphoglycerate dehydrogenase [Desulfovibrionaceae bacterium]MBO4793318.1 phosphoglycerate dehydrogenase [Deltaproteobacteria bacterium]MBR5734062.1 phosphoglycerate dehydrogenase [Desulfovibrionaceae bacterium]
MRIAITPHSFARYSKQPLRMLEEMDVGYVLNDKGRRLTEDETIDLLEGCTGLIAGSGPVTRRLMEMRPGLKAISRCGPTLENIDTEFAAQKQIKVTIAPIGHGTAVAELAVSLMICLLRNINSMDRAMREGVWKKRMGWLLQNKKVGIVGFGTTGHTVMKLLAPFHAKVAYNDPFVDDPIPQKMELDELLEWADIVTLHCPRVEGGYLLDAGKLARMKPGSLLLNLAKGGLVDEDALNGLLLAGHLAGAALDVFGREPYEGPLRERDNIILTPHIGAHTREARVIMEMEAVRNILNALSE